MRARIQRAPCTDKNLGRLDALRTRRLYQLALAEGKPYQPEAYFSTAPARESRTRPRQSPAKPPPAKGQRPPVAIP